MVGALCKTKPGIEAPGVDYVVAKSRFVFARNAMYYVDHESMLKGKKIFKHEGLRFEMLTPDKLKQLMA
jgi:hypothetical protein